MLTMQMNTITDTLTFTKKLKWSHYVCLKQGANELNQFLTLNLMFQQYIVPRIMKELSNCINFYYIQMNVHKKSDRLQKITLKSKRNDLNFDNIVLLSNFLAENVP